MDTDIGEIGWSDAPKAAYEAYHKSLWPNIPLWPWEKLSQQVRKAWAEAFYAGRSVQIDEDNDE